MSEDQKKPRNRLADLLFLGGSLSAAAVLVAYQTGRPPQETPSPTPTQQVQTAQKPAPSSTPDAEASPQLPDPCATNHPGRPDCIVERDPFVNELERSTNVVGRVHVPRADQERT